MPCFRLSFHSIQKCSLLVLSALILSHCGPATGVDLKADPPTSAPTNPNPKPGDGTPGTGATPAPTPLPDGTMPPDSQEPTKPKYASYRLMCIWSKALATTSHMVSPGMIPQMLLPNEVARIGDTKSPNGLLSAFAKPVGGPGLAPGWINVVTQGTSYKGGSRLYYSRILLTQGTGVAAPLNSDANVGASSGAASLAQRLHLTLTNYGVSSKGNYLLVPGGGQISILSARDLRRVGRLPVEASRGFFPQLWEDRGYATILVYDGSRFVPEFYRVKITGDQVEVGERVRPSLPLGHTAFAPSPTRAGYAWATASLDSPSNLGMGIYDSASGKSSSLTLRVPSGPKVAMPLGLVVIENRPLVVAAMEEHVKVNGAWKMKTAKAVYIGITSSGLSIEEEFAYSDATKAGAVKQGLLGNGPIMKELYVAPGGSEVFMVLPTDMGTAPHHIRDGEVTALLDMMGSDCLNGSAFEEIL
jgi:hypothetical protein